MSSSFGKEIITFQFGSVSNYVGAQYFNIQNAGFSFNPEFPTDINHDILFKEGVTSDGAFSYTPRLISVDLEESLHSLSRSGRNFSTPPPPAEVQKVTHTDKVDVVQVGTSPEKNEYFQDIEKQAASQEIENAMDVDLVLKTKYDLTRTIRSWPEILTLNLHPRSLTMIPKPLVAGLELPKTTSKIGTEIWRNVLFADDFEDNLRFQLEACDTVQGFHLLTECDNLHSGISGGCLDYLRDECGKKSIITIPVFNLYKYNNEELESRKQLCSNLINTAFCFTKSQEHSDLVVPLSTIKELWAEETPYRTFRDLVYDGSSIYQSSSIMAACLELVSSPYRLKRLPEVKMSNIVALLSLPGRKFVGAGVVFPFPERKIEFDILSLLRRHSYASLCPHVPLQNTLDTQSVTIRGFPHERFPSSPALFVSPLNVRIPRTFPDIINSEHDLSNSSVYYGKMREVSALSGLCNTREMRTLIDKLTVKLRSLNVHKIPSFISSDLEKPEYDEMVETLLETSASYDISMFL